MTVDISDAFGGITGLQKLTVNWGFNNMKYIEGFEKVVALPLTLDSKVNGLTYS